ncbi:MAG: M23 family metallopeptidase, partial [Deltaproteobacteria bacterium]|nr:M23 family metallopeptidase [Deltaproteobacteria bacterium]
DGSIIFAANKSGNGKCVRVRHPNGWESMYNHMRGFGKKIRAGRKVQQGELIGYVGSTGLSTGPHLDFRLYKNGKPVNPLKVKSPPARPVSRANLANFKATAAGWVAFMDGQPVKGNANASQTLPAPLVGNNGVRANNI